MFRDIGNVIKKAGEERTTKKVQDKPIKINIRLLCRLCLASMAICPTQFAGHLQFSDLQLSPSFGPNVGLQSAFSFLSFTNCKYTCFMFVENSNTDSIIFTSCALLSPKKARMEITPHKLLHNFVSQIALYISSGQLTQLTSKNNFKSYRQ